MIASESSNTMNTRARVVFRSDLKPPIRLFNNSVKLLTELSCNTNSRSRVFVPAPKTCSAFPFAGLKFSARLRKSFVSRKASFSACCSREARSPPAAEFASNALWIPVSTFFRDDWARAIWKLSSACSCAVMVLLPSAPAINPRT